MVKDKKWLVTQQAFLCETLHVLISSLQQLQRNYIVSCITASTNLRSKMAPLSALKPNGVSDISNRYYFNCSLQRATTRKTPSQQRRPFNPIRASSSVADLLMNKTVVTLGEALFGMSSTLVVFVFRTCSNQSPPHQPDCLADQLGKPKEEVSSWSPYPGGAPANVATGLSKLGAKSILLAALGDDDLGAQFSQLLQERGVVTEYIQLLKDHPTRDVLVTRSLDGDRTFAGFGKTDTENYADAHALSSHLPFDLIASADALVTGTLGLAYEKSAECHYKAVETANSKGHCIVIIDVNWRPVFWTIPPEEARLKIKDYITQADILKVTDEEACWLWGMSAEDALEHPEHVLSKAASKTKGVLVSAGEKGSAYAFRAPGGKSSVSGCVPVMDVKVVDTTGAGDSYLSGFIFYTLMAGGLDHLVADPDKLRRAVEFATACGAVTCRKPGAIDAQPTLHDVEELLAVTRQEH